MSQPRVTAIVPLHNHRQWVLHAVSSIDDQDYPDKRIVVVDDGSTDGGHIQVLRPLRNIRGVEIGGLAGNPKVWVGEHQKGGTEVWVVRYETARGPSFARNRGMEVASAQGCDVFAFLDSDDYYLPGKISESVERFTPGVGAVYSDYDTLRPDGLLVREWKPGFTRERLVRECIVNCDSLVSVQAIAACGGFDEMLRVCEDFDLWLRLSEKFVIAHVAEALVVVRVGQHSSSATVRSDIWRANYQRVMQKARERAGA